jgi:hypothetical protein
MTHLTEEQLNDLADELIAGPELTAAQAHLSACAVCRDELAGLRQLLAEVSALPTGIAPVRDLLPEIHAALDRDQAVPLPARWRMRTLWSARWSLAAAAIVLIVATAVITRAMVDRAASPAPFATTNPSVQLVSAEATALEQKYQNAITELQTLIEVQRATLPPTTLQLLEDNLRVIDAAIRDSRQALQRNPDNELINESLWSSYERKLELLRRATEVTRT